jgi:hypothetical protein
MAPSLNAGGTFMSIFQHLWFTFAGAPKAPPHAPEAPSLERLAEMDRFFLSLPMEPGGAEGTNAGEFIAQAQDLCRVAAFVASQASETEPSPKVRLAGRRSSALLPLAIETLIEKAYPLASQLQGERWPGPRLPHDILPRLDRRLGRREEYGQIPEDLYTATEIGGWLAEAGAPALEGLHTYRHNLFCHEADDSSDLATRVFAMRPLIPLGFVAREHGWQRTLEFLDALWAQTWLMDLRAAEITRGALLRCLSKNHPRPASVAEALGVLRQELAQKYFPEGHEVPSFLAVLAPMQAQLDSELKHLRHNSRTMTEWLRGLHALLLPTNHVAHMLWGAARQAASSLVPDLQRRHRFYEEIRADIVGCLEDPWMYVPHAIAAEVVTQRTRRDAKRALMYYCHSRVFIPLAIIPAFEAIIDSLPDWPPPDGSKVLHTRFAARLKACTGGGFAQAYALLFPEDHEAQWLAAEAKWSQLKSSPEYQALPYLGRAVAFGLYLTSGRRGAEGPRGDGSMHPEGLALTPKEENSHHPKVTFVTGEQGHIQSAEVMIRSNSSEDLADYDTSGASEALIALLKGIQLAARNDYPTERLKYVFIGWPGRPVRLGIGLDQGRFRGFWSLEAPPPSDAAQAGPRCDPRERVRVMNEFGAAFAEAVDDSLVWPEMWFEPPPGLS